MDNNVSTYYGNKYNTYVGARYVPLIMGEWNANTKYEPLSVVLYQGNSYTSKTFVPKGVLPTVSKYWVMTGNYDAQVEMYRQETEFVKGLVQQSVYVRDTVQEMVNDTRLKVGNIINTKGYYTPFDGGSGSYVITTDFDDDRFNIPVSNGLFAIAIGDSISVKACGAKGDGISNDYECFVNACKYPNTHIGDGVYRVQGSSPISVHGNIYATSNSKINLYDGCYFDTTPVDEFECVGGKYYCVNTYDTINEKLMRGRIFYGNNPVGLRRYMELYLYANICNCETEDNSQFDGTKRSYCAIDEVNSKFGSIYDNIEIFNFQIGVRTNGSGFVVNNLKLMNFETGVYILEQDSSYYTLSNIKGFNTFEQSKNWMGKVNAPTSYNGKCLVLCDGHDVVINNLHAENPVERCIYCQATNVTASTMYCSNGAGFKFVGKDKGDGTWIYADNMLITDMILEINEDLREKTHQNVIFGSQMYFNKNTVYKNFHYILNSVYNPLRNVCTLTLSNYNITFDNINAIVRDRIIGAIGTNESYDMLCDGLTIKNCSANKSDDGTRIEGTIFGVDLRTAPVSLHTKYLVKNVKVENCIVDYTNTLKDNSVVAWNNVDGGYFNVKGLKSTYVISGLPLSEYLYHRNIVLDLDLVSEIGTGFTSSAPRLKNLSRKSVVRLTSVEYQQLTTLTFTPDYVSIQVEGNGMRDYVQFPNVTTGYLACKIITGSTFANCGFNGLTQTLTQLGGETNYYEVRETGVTIRGDVINQPFNYVVNMMINYI